MLERGYLGSAANSNPNPLHQSTPLSDWVLLSELMTSGDLALEQKVAKEETS